MARVLADRTESFTALMVRYTSSGFRFAPSTVSRSSIMMPVMMITPASFIRFARQKGLGKIVECRAVNHDSRFSNGIDKGPTCRISKNVDLSSFCSIHEGLTHITEHHEFP